MLLHDLQLAFYKAIFQQSSHDQIIFNSVIENNIFAKNRIQIYRNNIFINLKNALKINYPTSKKIVGKEFFDFLCQAYIPKYPSHSGDLNHYGKQFPLFLSHCSHVNNLPYLTEMAILDWACHEILAVPEVISLDWRYIAELPPNDFEMGYFSLHPACQILVFEYPVFEIWQLCYEPSESEKTVNWQSGGMKLLLQRKNFAVDLIVLTEQEYIFLNTITKKKFAASLNELLNIDPHFAVVNYLEKYIANNVIVGFAKEGK